MQPLSAGSKFWVTGTTFPCLTHSKCRHEGCGHWAGGEERGFDPFTINYLPVTENFVSNFLMGIKPGKFLLLPNS